MAPLSIAASGELVDVGDHIEGLVTDMRYAGEKNFLGRPVAGYSAA